MTAEELNRHRQELEEFCEICKLHNYSRGGPKKEDLLKSPETERIVRTNPYLRWIRIVFDMPANEKEKELAELWKKLSVRKRRFMTHKDEFTELARYALKEPFSWEGVDVDLREDKERGIQVRNIRLTSRYGSFLVDVAKNLAPTAYRMEEIQGKLFSSLLAESDTAGMLLGMGIEHLYAKDTSDYNFLNVHFHFIKYLKQKSIKAIILYLKRITEAYQNYGKVSYAGKFFLEKLSRDMAVNYEENFQKTTKLMGEISKKLNLNEKRAIADIGYKWFLLLGAYISGNIEEFFNNYHLYCWYYEDLKKTFEIYFKNRPPKFSLEDLMVAIKTENYVVAERKVLDNMNNFLQSVFTPEQVVEKKKRKKQEIRRRLVL